MKTLKENGREGGQANALEPKEHHHGECPGFPCYLKNPRIGTEKA